MKTRATIWWAVLLAAGCTAPRVESPAHGPDARPAHADAESSAALRPGSDGAHAPAPPKVALVPAEPSVPFDPAAWAGAHSVATHVGTYLVRWRATLEPLEQGTTFSIDACVFDARSPERLVTDVALDIDAGMPQHGHGLARQPRVTRQADGSWRAEGMRFHMLGRWELFFDVTRGALTERAQVSIPIE